MDRRSSGSFLWMYLVVLVFAMAPLIGGIVLLSMGRPDHGLFAAGGVGIVGILLAFVVTINFRALQQETHAPMQELAHNLFRANELLAQIAEQQLISERTKSIAFRERDREALRKAVREEITHKRWEGAMLLVNEFEQVFGNKAEADQFRGEIMAQWDSEVRRHVDAALAVIDKACREEQWSAAMHEAERVAGMFPRDVQAQQLMAGVEARRQRHKQQLLENWQSAVAAHDIDGSIEILKSLDLYLTPQEAVALQEPARQIFKDKLQMLGQQFTLAVKEQRWVEAVKLGETIAAEFPNSRMAAEVNEKMAVLKQRAAEPAAV